MASYIGKIQIGEGTPALVGSTLYGICKTEAETATKTVITTDDNSGKFINNNYDQLLQGTTIHVKFTNGNTITSGCTLQVGTLNAAQPIVGNFICEPGAIISFTLDEREYWVANDDNDTTYTFSEGSTTGAFSFTPSNGTAQSVAIHGLNDAAYKGVVTNLDSNTSSTAVPTAQAVAQYVQDQTGGLSGLTGAMHFRGITTTDLTNTANINSSAVVINNETLNAISGDVVLLNEKEYVWTGSQWILLGDEGSYALKSSTATVIGSISITASAPTLETATVIATQITSISAGSAADLQTTTYTVPNVTTAGTATTASVTAGILTLFIGTDTQLGTNFTIQGVNSFTANTPTSFTTTNVSVNSVTAWNAGQIATITTAGTTVVVPNAGT